jgi:hypothetical protein
LDATTTVCVASVRCAAGTREARDLKMFDDEW